jgi:multiple sugar transport system ATP-binding protein
MALISFDGVGKRFPDGTEAVSGLDLVIRDGEFLVLVGPSGCGKTTTLRMLAGLDLPTTGVIRIDDQDVTRVASHDRNIAMVFQNYALYPHMTVLDNLAFGLRMKGVRKAERHAKAREVAAILGLEDYLARRPKQLSGGQRQRLAMGRAIVREPRAFLMDEPLSNLDAKMRVQMRAEIARLQRRLGTTTLYVTHDQVEAMTMGDRVGVMKDGVLQQVASPAEVYERPANVFVAGFIGSPGMNLCRGVVRGDASALAITVGDVAIPAGPATVARHPGLRAMSGREVVLGVRPEHAGDSADAGAHRARVPMSVEFVERLGSDLLVHATWAGGDFVARCDARSSSSAGARIEMGIDTDRLHLFDPTTGLPV